MVKLFSGLLSARWWQQYCEPLNENGKSKRGKVNAMTQPPKRNIHMVQEFEEIKKRNTHLG